MRIVPPLGEAEGAVFVDEVTEGGIEGSPVPAEFFNAVNTEIAAIITAGGLVPSGGDNAQAVKAIKTLMQRASPNVATAAGTADAITASYSPPITALTNGMTLMVRANTANATTTPTFTPASGTITAATIVKGNGLPLAAGDIAGAGHWIDLQYDATLMKWVLLNPATGVTLWSRKNSLFNGAMRVAQRVASGALTTAFTYPSLDRWCAMQSGTAAGILAQVAGGPAGFQYGMKLARNSGAATTGALTVLQAQETINSIPLSGQTVTLSFWAKAGANYSGGALASAITQGTGTDQSAASYATWTGASTSSQNNTLTTSYQRFAQTLTLSPSTTQLATSFSWTPSGTAGGDDAVYITGVQLEASPSATAFEVIDYGEERRRCQRYCFSGPTQSAGLGASAGGGFGGAVAFPVEMRVTPALSTSGVTYVNCYSLTTTQITPTGYVAWVVTSSANSYYVLFTILASAEL
jgi:hypothetical protein